MALEYHFRIQPSLTYKSIVNAGHFQGSLSGKSCLNGPRRGLERIIEGISRRAWLPLEFASGSFPLIVYGRLAWSSNRVEFSARGSSRSSVTPPPKSPRISQAGAAPKILAENRRDTNFRSDIQLSVHTLVLVHA